MSDQVKKTQLTVRQESLAERCEICHKEDRFDRKTNRCTRCDNVTKDLVKQSDEARSNVPIPGFLRELSIPRSITDPLDPGANIIQRLIQRGKILYQKFLQAIKNSKWGEINQQNSADPEIISLDLSGRSTSKYIPPKNIGGLNLLNLTAPAPKSDLVTLDLQDNRSKDAYDMGNKDYQKYSRHVERAVINDPVVDILKYYKPPKDREVAYKNGWNDALRKNNVNT